MAYGIHIITSSSDHYTIAFDNFPSLQEIINKLKEELGDEYFYIDNYYTSDNSYNKELNKIIFGEYE